MLRDLLITKKNEGSDVEGHIYVGDGMNDYCPGLCLNSGDHFFVRKNFSLFKRLQSKPEYFEKLKCKVVYWSDADQILESLPC